MNPGFTNEDEAIPYRSIPTAPDPEVSVDIDESEYSTLSNVKKILDAGVESVKVDVTKLDASSAEKLQASISGKQEAYAILEPIQNMVNEAIKKVEIMRKGTK